MIEHQYPRIRGSAPLATDSIHLPKHRDLFSFSTLRTIPYAAAIVTAVAVGAAFEIATNIIKPNQEGQ